MISTGMVGTPRHGNGAVEREQEAGEDIALRRAAMGEDRFARTGHVRRLGIVADHLQREIGLDAGAHVERAGVDERPAAVIALNAPKIDGDQALEFEIGLLAAEMPEQHVFGGDRRVGLEFETPMAVLVLLERATLSPRGRCDARAPPATADLENDRARCSLRRSSSARRLGAFAPEPVTIEAAL